MKLSAWLATVLFITLAIVNSVFVVDEGERAVVSGLGGVVRSDLGPGLHFKFPFVERVRAVDTGPFVLPTSPQGYMTAARQEFSADVLAVARVQSTTAFEQAAGGDIKTAAARLAPVIHKALQAEIGRVDLAALVAMPPGRVGASHLAEINRTAAQVGLRIDELRLRQVALPAGGQVVQDIYRRMTADRQQAAARLRAEGEQEALAIREKAESDRRVILAEAERDAQRVRGEGDAEAARLYNEAAQKDPAFFAFQRSLDAYRRSFNGRTVIVLDRNDPFLQYLTTDH